MTRFGGFSIPGSGAIEQTTEYEVLWGGDYGKGIVLSQSAVYSGAMRDAGNTPTTVMRGGMLMGKETTSGELSEWDLDATDGSQHLWGVLPIELRAQDFDANNADRAAPVIIRAPLKASSLLIQGVALVGHADEFAARRQLVLQGCILDDDPQGFLTGLINRTVVETGATLTPTTAQNGTTFILELDGAVAVTLPTCQPDLTYTFWRHNDTDLVTADPPWTVTTASGADVLMGEGLDSLPGNKDTITYTTDDEHQGTWVRVRGIYHNTTAKWLVEKNEGLTYAFSVT